VSLDGIEEPAAAIATVADCELIEMSRIRRAVNQALLLGIRNDLKGLFL
jgi:hypothetical protein